MRVRIEFPCRQYTDVRHWAIVDVSRYPETWRIIRSDVLETPILREFDPCTQLLLKGYTKYPNGEQVSFRSIFYESLCKNRGRLPKKGMIHLLERIFRDDIRNSWENRNANLTKGDHARLVRRIIGKYVNSYRRFYLFIWWNSFSEEDAFLKTCLKLNPKLTARVVYQILKEEYQDGLLPGKFSYNNSLIKALLHPPGHRYLIRFFETRNHEKIVQGFVFSPKWLVRQQALQYEQLALLTLDELEPQRKRLQLQPLPPNLQQRAMKILETVWEILVQNVGSIEVAQKDFAAMLSVPPHFLPRF